MSQSPEIPPSHSGLFSVERLHGYLCLEQPPAAGRPLMRNFGNESLGEDWDSCWSWCLFISSCFLQRRCFHRQNWSRCLSGLYLSRPAEITQAYAVCETEQWGVVAHRGVAGIFPSGLQTGRLRCFALFPARLGDNSATTFQPAAHTETWD